MRLTPAQKQTRALVQAAAAVCEEKKALDTRILELDSADSGLSDFFLVTSATNERQAVAIADEIEMRLKRERIVAKLKSQVALLERARVALIGMRSGHVQVKAAGGVRDLDTLLKVRALGVSRCGATRTKEMLDEVTRRLNLPGSIAQGGKRSDLARLRQPEGPSSIQ